MADTIFREIQEKRDIAANFATNDPILYQGQIAFLLEPDTGDPTKLQPTKFKVGNGKDPWSILNFFSLSSGQGDNNRVEQTGNTIDYVVGGVNSQIQWRDLNSESGDITITNIANIPLNQSIVIDINGLGNTHNYIINVPGTKVFSLSTFQVGKRNIMTIVSLNDTPGSELYVVNFSAVGTLAFGTAAGTVAEIGATIVGDRITEWNGSGQLISVAKATGYNKAFADDVQNLDPSATGVNMDPRGVNRMIEAKLSPAVLTDGATVTWNYGFDPSDVGALASVTLAGNRTLAISGVSAGNSGTLIVRQDATGGRTLTLPAGSLVVNGGGGAITLSSGANNVDIISFLYDGTNYYWWYGLNFT